MLVWDLRCLRLRRRRVRTCSLRSVPLLREALRRVRMRRIVALLAVLCGTL